MAANWMAFSYWQKEYEGVSCVEGPFQGEPITDRTVFLWNEMAASIGGAVGIWDYFPEPKALAAYLRFRLLPVFFEIWLVRNEWDSDTAEFIRAEELFSRALESGVCRYEKDIPLMKSLIGQLDGVMALDDDAAVMAGLQQTLKAFNDKWDCTGTWNFRIRAFADPAAVGEEIHRRDAEADLLEDQEYLAGMSKKEWQDRCSRITSDPVAQESFLNLLRESDMV